MAGGKKDSNTLGRSIIRERRGVASAEDKDVVQLVRLMHEFIL